VFTAFVTGPLAAVVFVAILQNRRRRLMLWFWPLLIVLHIVSWTWMYLTFGWCHAFPGAGWIAQGIMPWAALLTFVALSLGGIPVWLGKERDAQQQFGLATGTVVIPLLQVLAGAMFLPLGVPLLDTFFHFSSFC
jgi:hypothetical protein